jgi:hypothetical protein
MPAVGGVIYDNLNGGFDQLEALLTNPPRARWRDSLLRIAGIVRHLARLRRSAPGPTIGDRKIRRRLKTP